MKYLITGGSGGLGKALCAMLPKDDVTTMGREGCDINVDFSTNDLQLGRLGYYGVVIHCAGANFIRRHKDIATSDIDDLIRINATSQFLINKHLLTDVVFPPQQIIHIISDAAWTPMTHSLAYNMSKAAQLMMMRQMAHEEKRSIIYGISPGKIANTGMSEYIDHTFPAMRGLTYEEGRKYQLSKLKTGEMQPELVAEFILLLAAGANKHYHGHNFVIGG